MLAFETVYYGILTRMRKGEYFNSSEKGQFFPNRIWHCLPNLEV